MILTREKDDLYEHYDDMEPLLCDSSANRFVPIYAGFQGTAYTKKGTVLQKRVLIYGKPKASVARVRRSLNRENLDFAFLKAIYLTSLVSRRNYSLKVKKGIVFIYRSTLSFPVLCLTVDRDYLFNLNWDNIDYTKLCLMVDYRLMDKEYASVKTLLNPYIKEAQEKRVTIMYTDDISDKVFKMSYEYPKFETLQQRNNYLSSLNSLLHEPNNTPST